MATNTERARAWRSRQPLGYWRKRNRVKKREADRRYTAQHSAERAAYLRVWRAARSPEQVAADKAAQRIRRRRWAQLKRLRESVAQRKSWRRSMHAMNRALRRWKTPEQLAEAA